MQDEAVEMTECDRKENEVREQCLDNHRRRPRSVPSQERGHRGNEPEYQQGQREILQEEADYIGHFVLTFGRIAPSLTNGTRKTCSRGCNARAFCRAHPERS